MHEWLPEWIGQPKGHRLFLDDNMLTKFSLTKLYNLDSKNLLWKYIVNWRSLAKNLNLRSKDLISFPLNAKAGQYNVYE